MQLFYLGVLDDTVFKDEFQYWLYQLCEVNFGALSPQALGSAWVSRTGHPSCIS